jgi:hypothetical protein
MNVKNTQQISITNSTQTWTETLYEAGAVSFEGDKNVVLHPRVRELVRAMHAVLAGGTVQLEIQSKGGPVFSQLEAQFDAAWTDVAAAYADSDGNVLPVGP